MVVEIMGWVMDGADGKELERAGRHDERKTEGRGGECQRCCDVALQKGDIDIPSQHKTSRHFGCTLA